MRTFRSKSCYRKIIAKASEGALCGTMLLSASACTSVSNAINPFYEDPAPEAMLGDRNDHALSGEKSKSDTARQALEQVASYQRAHSPSPAKPVMQPAVVRLMWVPDHVNRTGDLIPAHFYYLKVLKDRWAVDDAFELEGQLSPRGGSSASIPYVPAK